MTPRTQENLRAAWHGPMTAPAIARKFHQGSARTVQRFWKAEQDAGRLPAGARPHFRHCTSTLGEVMTIGNVMIDARRAVDLDLDREIARAELVATDGCGIASPDPLLAALKRHHAGDLRRRCDDHVFDDRLTEPSAKHCRAQRRFRDRVMIAIAKNPGRFEAAFGVRAI